ncbi:MAG: cell division protein ZapA [Pseudomonadota bacterium]
MAKVDISIRDRLYSISCAPGQEARLLALSKQLDLRVRDVHGAVGDIGDDRLLMLTALALLDELDAARRGQASATGPEVDRAAEALNDAAARIDALAARITGTL